MLILELLPPTMFILSRSNGGQVVFCSQHFEKHGKLNTCFSGQWRSVSVPGWVCSLQEQKKIICYSSSNGLMCSFFMFWCWLLLASAFSLPPSSPPQPKPGGQPSGMSFGKQQQCFPCGSCFQLSPLIPMSHDLQCTEQIDVRHTHSNSLDSQKKKKRKRGWEWGGRFPCFSPALLIPAGACLPRAWFMAVTKKQCLPSSSVLSMRSSWIKGKAPVEAPAVSSAFSTAPPNETSPRQQSRASVFYVSPGW